MSAAQIEEKRGTRFVPVLRKVAYSIGGLVFLIACLAIAAILFPPGWLARDFIVQAVEQQTGRELQVAGASKLTLRPNIKLRLEKVALSGQADGTEAPTFTSDSIEIEVKIIDLWQRRFEIPHIVLVRPVATLTAGDPLLTRVAEGKVTAAGIPQQITVRNGTITFAANRPQDTVRLDKVTGLLLRTADGGGMSFNGSLAANGETIETQGLLRDLAALAAGRGSAIVVSVQTNLFHASVDGVIATQPIGQIIGKVTAKTEQFPQFLQWLNVDPTGANLGQTAAIEGQIASSLRRLSVNPGTIMLDAIKGTVIGELSIDDERPTITASLTTDKLDIDAILPKASRPAAFAIAPLDETIKLPTAWESLLRSLKRLSGQRHGVRLAAVVPDTWWSTQAFTLENFPNMDVELAVSANEITYAELPLKNGRLTLHSNPKKLKVLLRKIELYKGDLSGRVEVDLTEAPLSTGLRLKFKQMQLGPFVSEVLNQKLFNGIGDVEIAVDGKGGSMRELVGSLDGSAVLGVGKGEIVGFDLRRAVLNFGQGQAYNPGRRTRFERLKGSFSLGTGVLRSTETLALTGPDVDLTAAGTLGLVSGRLDQRLNLRLKPPPPFHLPIPLRVRGTIEKPRIDWSIFSAVAEPDKFSTPFAVGLESEGMPAEVRREIEKILASETSKTQLSDAARQFLRKLLQGRGPTTASSTSPG